MHTNKIITYNISEHRYLAYGRPGAWMDPVRYNLNIGCAQIEHCNMLESHLRNVLGLVDIASGYDLVPLVIKLMHEL